MNNEDEKLIYIAFSPLKNTFIEQNPKTQGVNNSTRTLRPRIKKI